MRASEPQNKSKSSSRSFYAQPNSGDMKNHKLQVKKHPSVLLSNIQGTIAEESEGNSASLTPIGLTPSHGGTEFSLHDPSWSIVQKPQDAPTPTQQDYAQKDKQSRRVEAIVQQLDSSSFSGKIAMGINLGPAQQAALPHFYECQQIENEDALWNTETESPPGISILTPLNPPNNEESNPIPMQDFTTGADVTTAAALPITATGAPQRPFRSVSPVKTFKLLRDVEALKVRSEQHFMEVVEKDVSSSEESSPMYQAYRQKKLEAESQAGATKKSKLKLVPTETAAADGPLPLSPSHQSSNNDRSAGVPRHMNKSDHDGAVEAQQVASPARRSPVINQEQQPQQIVQPLNQDALLEDSMGEESLEAEQRSFSFLHLLAFQHRNDAEEISLINKPPDGVPPKPKRVRGQSSHLEGDMKTRRKELLTCVFSFSDSEYRHIKKVRALRQSAEVKSARATVQKPSQGGGFSIKLQLAGAPSPADLSRDVAGTMQSRRSADNAQMVQRKGKGGALKKAFKIPIQACEKIESSESEEPKKPQHLKTETSPPKKSAHIGSSGEKPPMGRKSAERKPLKNALKPRVSDSRINQGRQSSMLGQAVKKIAKENNLRMQKKKASARKLSRSDSKKGSSQDLNSSSSSSDRQSPSGGSHIFNYDYEQFHMKLQIDEHLYSPGDGHQQPHKSQAQVTKPNNQNNSKLRGMPRLPMNLLSRKPLSPKHELLSQKSPSPRQPSIHGDGSPDRDGGHTERTHNKGRTLRFNLQECDYQLSSTNEQISMHHIPNDPHRFQMEQSLDQMRFDNRDNTQSRNFDTYSHAQPSNDNRSMACRSECLSEHYIKAKKFAALRKSTKKNGSKKQRSQATTNMQSDQQTAQGPSPPRGADTSSITLPQTESESLHALNHRLKHASDHYKTQSMYLHPAMASRLGTSLTSIQDLALLHQNKYSEPLSAGAHLMKKQSSIRADVAAAQAEHANQGAGNLTSRHATRANNRLQHLMSYNSPTTTQGNNNLGRDLAAKDALSHAGSNYVYKRKGFHETKDSLKVQPNAMIKKQATESNLKKGQNLISSVATKKRATVPGNYATIFAGKLDKLSQNFSKIANSLSDDSDSFSEGKAQYNSYLNLTQSPGHPSLNESNVRHIAEATEGGFQAKTKPWTQSKSGQKSILKKSKSNALMKDSVQELNREARLNDRDFYSRQILLTQANNEDYSFDHGAFIAAQNFKTSTKKSRRTNELLLSQTLNSTHTLESSNLGAQQIQPQTASRESKENLISALSMVRHQKSVSALVQEPQIIQRPDMSTMWSQERGATEQLRKSKNDSAKSDRHNKPKVAKAPSPSKIEPSKRNFYQQKAAQQPRLAQKNNQHLVSEYLVKCYKRGPADQTQGGVSEPVDNLEDQVVTFGKTAPTPDNLSPSINFYNRERSGLGAQEQFDRDYSPNNNAGTASAYSGGGNMLHQISSSLSPDDELRHARLQGSEDYGASPPYNKLMMAHAPLPGQYQHHHVQSLSPPNKHFAGVKHGAIQMLGSDGVPTPVRRNGANYLQNYLSHNEKLVLAHQKQQTTTLSDIQMKYRERNEVLDASAQSGRKSDNNSNGAAYFGGASSSGGGGVTGPHYSAAGLSPTMHMYPAEFSDYQPYADLGEDATGTFSQQHQYPHGQNMYRGQRRYS